MEVRGGAVCFIIYVHSRQNACDNTSVSSAQCLNSLHISESIKYLVIFRGKKLPLYFNIYQAQAHLMIQEQVSWLGSDVPRFPAQIQWLSPTCAS